MGTLTNTTPGKGQEFNDHWTEWNFVQDQQLSGWCLSRLNSCLCLALAQCPGSAEVLVSPTTSLVPLPPLPLPLAVPLPTFLPLMATSTSSHPRILAPSLQIYNIFGPDWSIYALWHLTHQTYSVYFQGLSHRERIMWWDGINYWYRNVPYRCKKCCHIWIVTDCNIIIFARLTPCLFAIGATPKETQLNCHRGAVKELFLRYQNTIQFLHMLR